MLFFFVNKQKYENLLNLAYVMGHLLLTNYYFSYFSMTTYVVSTNLKIAFAEKQEKYLGPVVQS